MTRGGGGFTQADRDVINKILDSNKKMETEITSLKTSLKTAHQVISTQNKTINYLHTQVNLANYRNDSNNQYGRKESIKLAGTEGLGNDAEKIIADIAREIENATRLAAENDSSKTPVHINLNIENDIQRCHFLGTAKKRVICKFKSYKQRMKFLRNKRIINGAKEGKYKNVFIMEDMTPLRARLVWYIKDKLAGKFCSVHTMNGTIRMKKNENDTDWLHVNNPDDLFRHLDNEADFDLKEFNKGLHDFQILSQTALPSIEDFFVG